MDMYIYTICMKFSTHLLSTWRFSFPGGREPQRILHHSIHVLHFLYIYTYIYIYILIIFLDS